MSKKRIALLGMILESNSFSPPTTEADYRRLCYMVGDEVLEDLKRPHPSLPAEVSGFQDEMVRLGKDCELVPTVITAAEPGGPVDHDFFLRTIAEMKRRLEAALPLDGVYMCAHGAMTSTEAPDPDGDLFEMIRGVVGPDVPFIATLDLHANVSERMVENTDVLVSYITNPHVDQYERAAESARLMSEMFAGMRPRTSFIRLPLVAPTVSLLTVQGPYADLINYGQSQVTEKIANVSVVPGFVYSNTPQNGIAVVVTARNDIEPARELAADLAARSWADRDRFRAHLTSIDDAVAATKKTGPAVILADVADNPGGGGSGNTTWIIEALVNARAEGVLMGVFNDQALSAAAKAVGEGNEFPSVFNADTESEFSKRFEVPAKVLALRDGTCVGRRGIWAGRSLDLGTCALLQIGGIKVVVGSVRKQCADPIFFEMFGLDIGKASAVVVKSRGHFRAGFDEFFPHEQVIEVDAPGLVSPIFDNYNFDGLPRPIYPLDPDTTWGS
jgi:microcystin degradation protein MlrC